MFNNTCICRYPRQHKVVFDNGSRFKGNFTPLLKHFYSKPILNSVKNPQANTSVEQVHQVKLNMLVTKDLDKKVFQYIYPWGETLASIAWVIRVPYYHTIMATPGQAVFVRYMLFNLAAVVD